MPRKRRRPKTRAGLIPADVVAYLLHGDASDISVLDAMSWSEALELDRTANPWRALDVCHAASPVLQAWWADLRETLIDSWVATWPGTRPFAWWLFDAPRWTEHAGHKRPEAEPRRRTGGTGSEFGSNYHRGLPTSFIDAKLADYYNGRAVDMHGKPIGQEFASHPTGAVAIDPNDPPRFESEAAYLERHGLLTAAERQQLTDDDFADEAIDVRPSPGVETFGCG